MKFGTPNEPADAAYQHDRSPLNFVDKTQRPFVVVQGEKDARVKADPSERIVSALKATPLTDRYVWGDTSVTVD
jgi:dipeptidyl aminopeptidase/acylaminoacyl peptidase